MNGINSLKVTISDLNNNRSVRQWTSDNLSVQDEAGDKFYGDEKGRYANLLNKFEKEQQLKEMAGKLKPENSQLIFDSRGNIIEKSNTPNYTNENISVIKSSGQMSSTAMKTLEELGEILSATPKEEIKEAMDLKTGNVPGKKATIGTFNIEWLGVQKRTEEDYKEIARVIKDSGAQILGIEEICTEQALKKVLKYLPDYGYILGKSAEQKVGVIFDKTRVKYDINSIDQITDAQISSKLRAPLLVNMKVDDGFDFTFVVAHLKARFDDKAIEVRSKQATKINEWVQEHLNSSKDKDVIIVGDFNDFAGSESLKSLGNSKMLHFLTEGAPDSFYSNIPYKGVIDHGILTTVDGGSMEEFIQGSLHTIDEKKYPKYEESVSDHKPVLFDFRSDIDND